ncbi:hypothetical protein HHI36_018500 [Cryptolaemus montrouzieri]|uniref:C2H2-type domain-containing protein n=1 Tax=Cryptolaemus montrouzieri TaxID=559131 RepID=A0ABD2P124_9CUCU
MDLEPTVVEELSPNSKKPYIRQEIINFKRRKISENEQFYASHVDAEVIFLDTDTALEAEPLTIEIQEEEQEIGKEESISFISDLVNDGINDEEYVIQDTEIVAEELEDGQHPLDDFEELEEGEIKSSEIGFITKHYRNYFPKEYQCPLCEKSFTQKGNLVRHYHTHTGAKPFICNLCGHKFTQKSNLQKHIATHNGDKKFECGICHKGFVQKANLIRHLRIHTGEKPFQCDLCGHKFTQKGNLNKHMQLHTSDTEAACDLCDSKFPNYSAKMKHEATIHGVKWQELQETVEMVIRKDFNCDECPAVFRTAKSLHKHKRFHE